MAGVPIDRIVFFLLLFLFSLPWALMAFKGLKTGRAHGRGGYILKEESLRLFALSIFTQAIGAAGFFFWGLGILVGVIRLCPQC